VSLVLEEIIGFFDELFELGRNSAPFLPLSTLMMHPPPETQVSVLLDFDYTDPSMDLVHPRHETSKVGPKVKVMD
jgi:hypothetical protein